MSVSELDALTLIRQVITKYTDAAPDAVQPEASLADLEVDSLSLAEMLFALEDTLGKSIAEPTQRPQTVADLMQLVQPYLGELAGKAAPQ
jgi:acyl carrier protein